MEIMRGTKSRVFRSLLAVTAAGGGASVMGATPASAANPNSKTSANCYTEAWTPVKGGGANPDIVAQGYGSCVPGGKYTFNYVQVSLFVNQCGTETCGGAAYHINQQSYPGPAYATAPCSENPGRNYYWTDSTVYNMHGQPVVDVKSDITAITCPK